LNYIEQRDIILAKENEPSTVAQDIAINIEQLRKRLDMLDQRLDNIDSIVTAVAERVMKQPATFIITCANCGHSIEIALFGLQKPRK
jgi:tRNA(Ser,Leu) C12 N-acetylase TAN1